MQVPEMVVLVRMVPPIFPRERLVSQSSASFHDGGEGLRI